MENLLLIAMVVVAVLIAIVVLLQKSSSMGLGAYSGSNESLFGAKGPASFLAKTTFILGAVFVVLAIWLGVLYNENKSSSIMDKVVEKNAAPQLDTTETKENSVPKAPQTK